MGSTLQHLRENLAGHVSDRKFWHLAGRVGDCYRFDAKQLARARFVGGREALDALQDVAETRALAPASCELLGWQLHACRAWMDAAKGYRLRWQCLSEEHGAPPATAPRRLEQAMRLGDPRRRVSAVLGLTRDVQGSEGGWLKPSLAATNTYRSIPGFDSEDFAAQCGQLLEVSDEPFEALMREQGRRVCGGEAQGLAVMLRALSGQGDEGLFAARDRGRRLGAVFGQLDLHKSLGQRVRWATDGTLLFPWPSLELGTTGRNVRVYRSSFSGGSLGEIAELQAVAAGCAASLCGDALPIECALATPASGCHGVGGLFAQLFPDRLYLRSHFGLSGRPLELAQRQALLCQLFVTRLACGLSLLFLSGDEPTRESALATLRRVVQWDCEPDAVTMFALPLEAVLPVAIGGLSGLSLHGSLRECFDEDYFRNPRFARTLREIMVGGGQLTVSGLAAALDASTDNWSERLAELLV